MIITQILLGILILVIFNLARKVKLMSTAADRLATSLGDLEATASDVVTAYSAAVAAESVAPAGSNDALLVSAADRVDAVTKALNAALAPVTAPAPAPAPGTTA